MLFTKTITAGGGNRPAPSLNIQGKEDNRHFHLLEEPDYDELDRFFVRP